MVPFNNLGMVYKTLYHLIPIKYHRAAAKGVFFRVHATFCKEKFVLTATKLLHLQRLGHLCLTAH